MGITTLFVTVLWSNGMPWRSQTLITLMLVWLRCVNTSVAGIVLEEPFGCLSTTYITTSDLKNTQTKTNPETYLILALFIKRYLKGVQVLAYHDNKLNMLMRLCQGFTQIFYVFASCPLPPDCIGKWPTW